MLFIDWDYQGKGYGKKLMKHWEADMKTQGFDINSSRRKRTVFL